MQNTKHFPTQKHETSIQTYVDGKKRILKLRPKIYGDIESVL